MTNSHTWWRQWRWRQRVSGRFVRNTSSVWRSGWLMQHASRFTHTCLRSRDRHERLTGVVTPALSHITVKQLLAYHVARRIYVGVSFWPPFHVFRVAFTDKLVSPPAGHRCDVLDTQRTTPRATPRATPHTCQSHPVTVSLLIVLFSSN